MTFPTREDADARLVAELKRIKISSRDDGSADWILDPPVKPRLDWLLLLALTLDLGLWVGLLAWWIWR